uniref:Selenoprotein W, 1 n=1 Tax=Pygocentrus nattereri TaxID=42514 RepID=A0AAR2JWK7_PYGNA
MFHIVPHIVILYLFCISCLSDCLSFCFFFFFFLLQYTKLKTLLEGEFPGDLEISGEGTPTTSGWFEVEVNGKLVHSKKNGDGFVDSEQKMAKIVSAIEKAMDK